MSETEKPESPQPEDPSPIDAEANDVAQTVDDGQATTDAKPAGSAATPEDIAQMRDNMLRAVADAENTRKQAAKEVADTRKYAVASLARDLLSVADNFERALAALSPDVRAQMGEAGQSLLTGVEMTEKELHAALARHGVEPVPAAKGDKFDPNIHQAAAQIPSDQPKDCIAEVVQAGWRIAERTLRPAMVAVSAGAPTSAAPTGGDAAGDGGDAGEPGQRLDTTI